MAQKKHDNLKKCERCKWQYPDYYLQPFVGTKNYNAICGVCALEVSNEIHAVNGVAPRKKFDGPMAESYRLDCISWRDRFPRYAP